MSIQLSTFAQVSIKGIVEDGQSKPISFANVVVLDSDSELIDGVITNEGGEFEISTNSGESFTIVISFIGFNDWRKEISQIKNIDLGIITLLESNNELDEVVISSTKPKIERKVDRLVFNVENSVVASGGDAIDILQKTPGVRVDSDNISLIGKSSVRVLINNRLSPLVGEDLSNYLRSLSSEDISKIEVITNPPARYEAEGNSGLINIVLKKMKKDYFGGNIRTTYRQATYPTGYLGGGITYQKNRWSLFGNLNSGDGSVEVTETNNIFFPALKWDADSKIRYFTKLVSGRVGIDYDISDKTSIGVQYLGATGAPDIRERTDTNIINNSDSPDSLLLTNADSKRKTYHHSINGHLKTAFDTIGRSMTIDVDYFDYNSNFDRINNTETFLPNKSLVEGSIDIFRNTSKQNIRSFTSGLNLVWPTKFTNLEFGGKISFIKNDSDVGAFNYENNEFITDSNQSNIFEYRESIQALYASASKSIKKWDFKIGFRLESTQTEGNSITLYQVNNNNYQKLFPTAYITYNPDDDNSWSIDYGKRINRPSYSDLNPFRWFSNPFSYTEGNPFLQPFFIDNLEILHLYKNNLNTSLYVSIIDDGSDQVTFANPETNVQATVRRNFLNEYTLGLSQSYTLGSFDWLETYLQYDIDYTKIKSEIPNTIEEQDGINFYFSIDNSLLFNKEKTLLGELNFWYSAPGVSGIDIITESYAMDLGLKWLFSKKQFQISLIATDIFRTNENTIKSVINQIRQEYRNYYDSRRLRLTVVYRFGNDNLRSKQKRFSNEEERQRAN